MVSLRDDERLDYLLAEDMKIVQSKKAISLADAPIMDVANMKAFLIQPGQIVVPFSYITLLCLLCFCFFRIGFEFLNLLCRVIKPLTQMLIFKLKMVILFNHFADMLL